MNRTHPLFIVCALSLLGLGACSAPPERTTRAVSSSSALAGADCTSNADCGATEFCAAPEGLCGGGTCTGRGINVLCVGTVQPVCGCDGVTYLNSCYARKGGASLQSEGACVATPAPALLQYADRYDVASPQATGVQTLELHTDGTYAATMADGSTESGSYWLSGAPVLPYAFTATDGSRWWTGQITTYAGGLSITRDGANDTATPEHTVGPSESLCDATGGAWSDDSIDPKTGLFCACPTGKSYVPAQGGCVCVD
jgi:hypothetical protein